MVPLSMSSRMRPAARKSGMKTESRRRIRLPRPDDECTVQGLTVVALIVGSSSTPVSPVTMATWENWDHSMSTSHGMPFWFEPSCWNSSEVLRRRSANNPHHHPRPRSH